MVQQEKRQQRQEILILYCHQNQKKVLGILLTLRLRAHTSQSVKTSRAPLMFRIIFCFVSRNTRSKLRTSTHIQTTTQHRPSSAFLEAEKAPQAKESSCRCR